MPEVFLKLSRQEVKIKMRLYINASLSFISAVRESEQASKVCFKGQGRTFL